MSVIRIFCGRTSLVLSRHPFEGVIMPGQNKTQGILVPPSYDKQTNSHRAGFEIFGVSEKSIVMYNFLSLQPGSSDMIDIVFRFRVKAVPVKRLTKRIRIPLLFMASYIDCAAF